MSDVTDPKTIDDLSEEEFAELTEAGRITEDGEILPAETDEGDETTGEVAGSENEGGEGDDAKTGGEAGEGEDKTRTNADPAEKGTDAGTDAGTGTDEGNKEDDPDKVMIPKARLDQEVQRRRKLEEERAAAERELAFLKGRDSVHKERSDTKTDKAEAQPKTVEQIEAEIDAIWQQADDGNLSLSEARKQERAKQAEIDELSQPKHVEKKVEPDPGYQVIAEREINREAQRVAAEHPYINEMTEADLAYCSAKVDEQIKAEGIKMPRNQIDASIMRMELIGKMATRLGPGLTGKELSKPATQSPPELTAEQKRQAAAANAADRQKKLDVAKQQPPSSTATGAAEGGVGEYTEEQILNMSESELEKLPTAVLDRLAN